jgi:hypothetical protein
MTNSIGLSLFIACVQGIVTGLILGQLLLTAIRFVNRLSRLSTTSRSAANHTVHHKTAVLASRGERDMKANHEEDFRLGSFSVHLQRR